jgi:hypothetical protein
MIARWQRAYTIATWGVIGAAFAYAACTWARWPRLTYFPVTGEWAIAPPTATSITITYPGIVLWGLGGLVTGALVGAGLCRLIKTERWNGLFGAWAITAVLLAGFYYTWSVWPW